MVRSHPLNQRPRPDRATYTRRRLLVASAGVFVPATVYSIVRAAGRPTVPTLSALNPSTSVVNATIEPALAQSVPTVPTASTVPPVTFDHDVGPGSVGDTVAAVQDRLRALAFDPGPTDGVFGPATERAVWAYQKFVEGVPREQATAVVTRETWDRMHAEIDIRPRRSGPGSHVEVLLPEQVAVVYVDDRARLITHISSGTGEEWCDVVTVDHDDGTQADEAICGVAVTPGGVFRFTRRVEGWRNSRLGRLYNPVYFNYGIAIHGASNVPNYPASHGCVRIPMHIAEYFPSLVANGDVVYVFDGVEQPETYGAQLPVFDYPDPNATTTTTSTSTTTSSPPTTQVESTTTTTHVEPPATGPPIAVASTTSLVAVDP